MAQRTERAFSFRHLTEEERSRVERNILSKKQTEWSDQERDLWAEYVLDGPYGAGVKVLMKGSTVEIGGKLFSVFPVSQEDAEQFVGDWIADFIRKKQFNPASWDRAAGKKLFLAYFRNGIKQLAYNAQRRMTIRVPEAKTDDVKHEKKSRRTGVQLISINETKEVGGLPNLDKLESSVEMQNDSFLKLLKDAEFFEVLKVVIGSIRSESERKDVKAAILKDLDGWSMKEIGAKFETTEGYAKQMCFRGRKTLRAKLIEVLQWGEMQ